MGLNDMPKSTDKIAVARAKNNVFILDFETCLRCQSPQDIQAALPKGWALTESIFRGDELCEFQAERGDVTVFITVRKVR